MVLSKLSKQTYTAHNNVSEKLVKSEAKILLLLVFKLGANVKQIKTQTNKQTDKQHT